MSQYDDAPPCIAVVDDDEDVRTALDALLGSFDYTTALFETADELLVSSGIGKIGCIVSDLQMPGTSGLQLARAVRCLDIPFILITAYPTPEVQKQAALAGVRLLLVKPFESSELIDGLRTIFER
jgi:FixJ family two-component response regulator